MNDEVDIYLARCLKNWVATHQPSSEGREKLLQQAARQNQPRPSFLQKHLLTLAGLKKMSSFLFFDAPPWINQPIYQMEAWLTPVNRLQTRLFYIPLELRLLP